MSSDLTFITNEEINQLVYKLYDLTLEEIKIVECSGRSIEIEN